MQPSLNIGIRGRAKFIVGGLLNLGGSGLFGFFGYQGRMPNTL